MSLFLVTEEEMVTLGEVEDLAQETRWLQAHNHSGLPAEVGVSQVSREEKQKGESALGSWVERRQPEGKNP